ncbi:ferritin-like domain-containing protein [Saccharopolyspora sp. NFXS83]|uniref:ferritin-like domain-containing protein n=1 Tax=Saccharopolyspora sp. NFXS83 TaxID=2993560 RepID=UPI00224B4D58|nr:ferritin-like domain-containing protein [Saccharopolyspora sp. NFXS83]MCX2729570.1 ferritin-like domain-containing protein [Saccharopolyspora sp. NFXS83]
MSIFDLPRLHFAGTAITRLPTGPRSGLYDLAAGEALTADGTPFPLDRPPADYHEHLDGLGERFEPDGRLRPDGRFGTTTGWNFGGNGHFWLDARISGWECAAGEAGAPDPVVGRAVDLWGHFNDHLATTHNRARVFDVDPASNWTTTVLAGQFCFGRQGRSHDTGYMAVGAVDGPQPPRWQNSQHVRGIGEHPLESWFRRSVVYQFAVDARGLEWLPEAETSEAVRMLRAAAGTGGLAVRYALSNMAAPRRNNAPDVWQVRGTIAPRSGDEERTCPAGRLLTAREARRRGEPAPMHIAAVHVTGEHTTFDLITAVPALSRSPEPGPDGVHRLGPRLDLGDLQLRTRRSGHLVARLPRDAYLADTDPTGGLVTVQTEPRCASPDTEGLVLVGEGQDSAMLLAEEESVVRIDGSCRFLDPADDGVARLAVRTYHLGSPAPLRDLRVMQFFNPRALPRDPRARAEGARCGDVRIVQVRSDGDAAAWAESCTFSTDRQGRAVLDVRCAAPGTTRLLLLPADQHPPSDPDEPGSAARAYDDDDRFGYWSAAGCADVRVLPDTRHLDRIPRAEVTHDVLYREVFARYELLYSFMADEVFSLADESRVATYARLIWLMSDPRHRDKTFYMPPTRDMTGPQARLLLAHLQRQVAARPPEFVARRALPGAITTRGQLRDALREAAGVELAGMLQYLYAAWSIPTHDAGRQLVRRGEWTTRQLRLACGDGAETLRNGMRGDLLNVAREEMMHFLVINNIITAMGLPFHLPHIDFGTVNHRLQVPLDLALEGFGLGSVQRFIALEQPHSLGRDLAGHVVPSAGGAYPYQSLSDLYAAIREGIRAVPDLFLVERGRGGGEHHLFMRRSLNDVHPDYQLEVDDVPSALFAIDFVTEHGEGNVLPGPADEDSHYDTFLRMSDLLMDHRAAARGERCPPWTPAYPVLRNPTLHTGDGVREPVTAPEARSAMILFNRSYFLMHQLMLQHFNGAADTSLRRSPLMNAAIDVMTGMLRPIAEHLVTLPSGRPGRTAGPSFELEEEPGFLPRPDVALRSIGGRFDHLARQATEQPGLPARVADLMRSYADHFRRSAP